MREAARRAAQDRLARRRSRAAAPRPAARRLRHSKPPGARCRGRRMARRARHRRRNSSRIVQPSAQAGTSRHPRVSAASSSRHLGSCRLDEAPESPRMIHVPGVREFVDQEVTHYRRRLEQEAGVQADRAAPRATAPACALPANLDFPEAQVRLCRKQRSARARASRGLRSSVKRCNAWRRSTGRSSGPASRIVPPSPRIRGGPALSA